MSEPNVKVENALYHNPARAFNAPRMSGLHGLKGLSFSYRLNQWGPKVGPSMIPANTFSKGYAPGLSGLSGPVSWFEGLIGIESPADILTDAAGTMASVNDSISPAGTQIQTLLNQAQGYSGAQDATTQQKAQACQAEAAGLVSSLSTLQSAAATLVQQITTAQADTTTTQDVAQSLKDNASSLQTQVTAFVKGIAQLQSDVLALAKYAQSGPSAIQSIENAVGSTVESSISTLTWILGGSAVAYFLLPSLLPRLAGGVRKAVRG